MEEDTNHPANHNHHARSLVHGTGGAYYKLKNYLSSRKELVILVSLIVVFAAIPVSVLLTMQGLRIFTGAQGTQSIESEIGTLAGNVTIGSDVNASGGQFIQFGTSAGGGTSFQPSSPYHATFYYMWYKAPTPDGSWSYWSDQGSPPNTWFSQYLPDSNPSSFDPANELYSVNNYNNFKWQMTKMADAKQEVALASWWGQSRKEDIGFNNIINDFMKRADNPYPNLRWAVYYEKEGFGNPSPTELLSDLNYIKTNYTNSPYYLKIGGKPVIFVYNAAHTGSSPAEDLARWQQVRDQTGFYVNMKTDPLNAGASQTAIDDWHEYAPAVRTTSRLPFWYHVSPGFWLDGQTVRLIRDSAAFENAVKSMVSSSARWKLTETWNEWGEGTSVEPGEQVRLNASTGKDEPDPNGAQEVKKTDV